MPHDVFISYASEDKNIADATCAKLEERGIRCWIAPRDVQPGANWGEAIIDAISGSRIMVFVFSSHSNRSPHVFREIERAVDKEVTIIPLRVENIMPSKSIEYFISAQHWLDAITPPFKKHLDTLADKILLTLGKPETAAASQAPQRKRRLVPALVVAALMLLSAALAWLSGSDRLPRYRETGWPDRRMGDATAPIPERAPLPTAEGDGAPEMEEATAVTRPIDPPAAASERVPQPNDSMDTARRVAPGETLQGDIGQGTTQQAWYTVAMPANGTFMCRIQNCHPEGVESGDIDSVVLFSEQGEPLDRTPRLDPGESADSKAICVSAGQVVFIRIRVHEADAAPYSLSCLFTEIHAADLGEPNQEVHSAFAMKVSDDIQATVGFDQDLADWYRIVAPAHGTLMCEMKNLHPKGVERGDLAPVALADATGEAWARTAKAYPGKATHSKAIAVSAGRVIYLQVQPQPDNAAPYSLSCRFAEIDASDMGEPNEDEKSACSLGANDEIRAAVGFDQDRADWYRLVMPADGTLSCRIKNLHEKGVEYGDMAPVYLFDEAGDRLDRTSKLYPGKMATLNTDALPAGQVIYIHVQAKERCAAPYRLSVACIPP